MHSQPLLGADEERDLAERFRRHDDLNAAWRLVISHLRLVVRIAGRYTGYGLPQEDLIQEGNVGLMKAVKRFDPRWNTRLASYAAYWIREEIHEYILKNWRIVKVATTKAKRKLFYKLRSAKKRLAWMTSGEARELAGNFGVDSEEVIEMEKRLYAHDVSFDEPADPNREGVFSPTATIEDWRFEPYSRLEEEELAAFASRRLHDALTRLDGRSRDIIERRWLAEEKATLSQLAGEYGISVERVRQIERRAIEKLRQAVAH